MDELEQAHLDYEQRREETIENLKLIYDNTLNLKVREMLEKAINFVKEKEI